MKKSMKRKQLDLRRSARTICSVSTWIKMSRARNYHRDSGWTPTERLACRWIWRTRNGGECRDWLEFGATTTKTRWIPTMTWMRIKYIRLDRGRWTVTGLNRHQSRQRRRKSPHFRSFCGRNMRLFFTRIQRMSFSSESPRYLIKIFFIWRTTRCRGRMVESIAKVFRRKEPFRRWLYVQIYRRKDCRSLIRMWDKLVL